MPLADKFHHSPHLTYTRGFAPEIARRQLRLSLLLVAATASAASILGFALPLGAIHATRDVTSRAKQDAALCVGFFRRASNARADCLTPSRSMDKPLNSAVRQLLAGHRGGRTDEAAPFELRKQFH
jgi:hypothetical protein